MASLNQVSIELELKGQREVLQGLKSVERANQTLSRGLQVTADSSNKNAKSLDRISREAAKVQREMDRLNKAVQKGSVSQSAFHGETTKLANRLRRLGMANARSEVMRYYRALNEARSGTSMLSTATVKATATNDAFENQVRQTTAAVNAQSGAQRFYGRNVSKAGVLTQQAGYQVGDFIVQVQSGTNAFVAFGQQATQIAGTLTLLEGKWVLIGSVLGIAIPLLTAVGAAFMRTRGEAKTFSDQLDKLKSVVSDLSAIQDILSMSTEELGEKYGEAAVSVREYARVEAQLQASLARSKVEDSISSLNNLTQTYFTLQDAGRDYRNTLNRIESDFEVTASQARVLESAFTDIAQAQSFEQQRAAVDGLLGSLQSMGVSLNNLPEPIAQMLLNFFKANRQIEEAEAIIQALEGGLENTADAARQIGPALQGAIDQANAFANAIDRAADRAAGIGISTAGLAAERKALEAGRTEAEAAALGAATSERERILSTVDRPGPQRDEMAQREFDRVYQATLAQQREQQRLDAVREARRPSASGGTGTASATQEDYLAKLRQEAELKLSMIGLSEQEQRRLEIENDLKQKGLSIEDKRIDQVLRAENALRMAQEAEKRREDIMNVVTSNIESALMSVVDGTKSVEDAFKGMLRTIILEIYKQQVAQPIAQGAGTFLSSLLFANGGAFNRGNVIPFANGGVVGSPTTFPMANGNTGLMGEAGPEAIMPLKRGKDGKLGVVSEGGGAVTVNNYFTVQANGDDSVKRIVRQQIPQIAEATKAAVVDSKRRGGSYGRAFG